MNIPEMKNLAESFGLTVIATPKGLNNRILRTEDKDEEVAMKDSIQQMAEEQLLQEQLENDAYEWQRRQEELAANYDFDYGDVKQ